LWPSQTAYSTYLAASYRQVAMNPGNEGRVRDEALDAAIDVLSVSLARVPDEVLALRLATLHRDRGDLATDAAKRREAWAAARPYYELALDLYPLSPEALAEYGAFLERTGEARLARAAYERAADLDPADPEAWAGLARVELAEGDLGAAVDVVERARALGPAPAGAVEGALRRAAEWPIEALALRARQARVILLASSGRIGEARGLLTEIQAAHSSDEVNAQLEELVDARDGVPP
jgi:Flp pilus assembly protein TadD